jgi:hypothetical protein
MYDGVAWMPRLSYEYEWFWNDKKHPKNYNLKELKLKFIVFTKINIDVLVKHGTLARGLSEDSAGMNSLYWNSFHLFQL